MLGAVTFAVLVALIWIVLAVVAVGLVNVAKWMVQTSTRHAVADGRRSDTPAADRPTKRLASTAGRR
jgi:hypothetical protein